MKVQPYLFFDGRCAEAMEFYRKTIGAEVLRQMKFKESPDKSMPPAPGAEDKIMHAMFRVGETEILASDGDSKGKLKFEGFALAISVAGAGETDRIFAALGEGGQVQLPPTKTFFSPRFCMLKDKFGVAWMVMAEH